MGKKSQGPTDQDWADALSDMIDVDHFGPFRHGGIMGRQQKSYADKEQDKKKNRGSKAK